MATNLFKKEQVYENVYLVFVDASGHSNVVRSNPRNVSTQAFDLLYEKIESRLKRVTSKNRCEIGLVWSWLGDGGMIAIHDNLERVSLSTTIEFVQDILNLDLPTLQSEFKHDRINGELHIRIAVHKGTITYTDEGQQGFIHSPDINWGAHLEKATPKDSIAISREVYDIMPNDQKRFFFAVGRFEERDIFIYNSNSEERSILRNWRISHGFTDCEFVQGYLQRISQIDKAELIDTAQDTVIDFGTTLNTCSSYLYSNARPIPYREAVCRLLKRGGHFICYMLAPDSPGARQLIELRGENTNDKLRMSMSRFQQFKSNNPDLSTNFKVFQFDRNPNFATMIIDPKSEDSACLYSPYLNIIAKGDIGDGRADMPHYLVGKNSKMYEYVWNYVLPYMESAKGFL